MSAPVADSSAVRAGVQSGRSIDEASNESAVDFMIGVVGGLEWLAFARAQWMLSLSLSLLHTFARGYRISGSVEQHARMHQGWC